MLGGAQRGSDMSVVVEDVVQFMQSTGRTLAKFNVQEGNVEVKWDLSKSSGGLGWDSHRLLHPSIQFSSTDRASLKSLVAYCGILWHNVAYCGILWHIVTRKEIKVKHVTIWCSYFCCSQSVRGDNHALTEPAVERSERACEIDTGMGIEIYREQCDVSCLWCVLLVLYFQVQRLCCDICKRQFTEEVQLLAHQIRHMYKFGHRCFSCDRGL